MSRARMIAEQSVFQNHTVVVREGREQEGVVRAGQGHDGGAAVVLLDKADLPAECGETIMKKRKKSVAILRGLSYIQVTAGEKRPAEKNENKRRKIK